MPMQNTVIFKIVKNENFLIFFLFLLHNIDCGYSLEPPRRGGYNEYPQSMLWSKNKAEAVLTSTHNLCFGAKIRKIGIPLHTPVSLYKSGV